MGEGSTEHKASFLIVIFFCLVLGTSALTIVNYLRNSEIETAVNYQEQRIKMVEIEMKKIQKVKEQTPSTTKDK